jgi:hypothetical protein
MPKYDKKKAENYLNFGLVLLCEIVALVMAALVMIGLVIESINFQQAVGMLVIAVFLLALASFQKTWMLYRLAKLHRRNAQKISAIDPNQDPKDNQDED